MTRRFTVRGALVVLAFLPTVAAASPADRIPLGQGERVMLPTPPGADMTPVDHVGAVSPIIYLERCKGGCTIHGAGIDDAKSYTSSIAANGDSAMGEYENAAGQTGAAADAEWNAVVACVKEVYSPFAAQVTDVKPTGATGYHMNVVAGLPNDIGMGPGILGVSPGVGCAPVDNHITYTFANAHGGTGQSRIWNLCWTIAQETAHTYSLDHAFVFGDGTSACNDPMTYRTDCGGEKFFRNASATCGENVARPCKCGATQNAHLTLQATFGPGVSTVPPPTVSVSSPAANAKISNGSAVVATAFSKRGIGTLELWLNGYKWAQVAGAKFGAQGQPESMYSLALPQDVPDGVIDIVVKAKDDIGGTTAAPMVTVTKGAPCVSETSCANGQRCDAGRCLWDPAVGEIGEKCTFSQFCLSGICQGTAEDTICTTACIPGVADSCENPDVFECLEQSPGRGVCWPKESDSGNCLGCASAGDGAAPFVFGLFGVALVLRRRRR